MSNAKKAPVLGIDLGTTKCLACIMQPGEERPTIVRPNPALAEDLMPSVFCMHENEPLVGSHACDKLSDPRYREVVRCVKRFMDQSVALFPRSCPRFSAIEISAWYLRHLRRRAEEQLELKEGDITRAVVTVPAYFGQIERRHTRAAAKKAGFDEAQLLDEPIAAAIGLQLHKDPGRQLVMVVDLGGGTLDVTLLWVGQGVGDCGFAELGRYGYIGVGGVDWDAVIAKLAFYPHKLRRDANYLQPDNIFLFDPSERLKIDFSETPSLEKGLVTFADEELGNLDTIVKRSEFLAQSQPLAELCIRVCDGLLNFIPRAELSPVRRSRKSWFDYLRSTRLKKVTWRDIDKVLMVGGGSRTQAVQDIIAERWGQKPEIAPRPQYQVGFGAAWCAGGLFHNGSIPDNILRSPHTIGHYYYPRGPGPNKPKVFAPVIYRNERISQVDERTLDVSAVCNGTTLSVDLAEERLNPKKGGTEYVDIGRITLTNLPPRESRKEKVELQLQCQNDRDMEITATFRGQHQTVNLDADTSCGPANNESGNSHATNGGTPKSGAS